VLDPDHFQVNEAWIAFKLNDKPIHTERDGDYDFIALQDAASGFILSTAPWPAQTAEPTQMDSRRLLKQGQAHKNQWPKTLFIPVGQPADDLSAEAERQGIKVVRIAEDQLLLLIGETRESFRKQFESGVWE